MADIRIAVYNKPNEDLLSTRIQTALADIFKMAALRTKETHGNLYYTIQVIVSHLKGRRHTFCASRDTRVSCGWCLLIQGYVCAVLIKTIRKKQNSASALGIQKEISKKKIGGNHAFFRDNQASI